MRIKALREALLGPLKMAASATAATSAALPILTHLKLEAVMGGDGDWLRVTGSNLEQQIRAHIKLPEGAVIKAGTAVLDAKRLTGIVNLAAAGAVIDISADDDEGKATILAGSTRYHPQTLAAGGFPAMDEGQDVRCTLEMPPALLAQAMGRAAYAMAVDDHRYYLNGMLAQARGGEVRLVASDGYRLATILVNANPKEDCDAIVPRRAILAAVRLLQEADGPCRATVLNNTLRLDVGDRMGFSARLIEGRFPDFARVLPRHCLPDVMIPREALIAALKRACAALGGGQDTLPIARVEGGAGRLSLSGTNGITHEEYRDELDVGYVGGDFEIGLNMKYMADAAAQLACDSIALRVSDQMNATMMIDPSKPDDIHVIMPARL